ncbi:MAG: leucyl aminopeptidase family protein [Burkholderiaceae bacterium]
MSEYLTDDASRAVPITPISKDALTHWVQSHPRQREWLNLTGFKADAGSFTFLPRSGGDAARVLAARGDDEPMWAFAALPMLLPEGVYSIDSDFDGAQATAAALGWSLGSYGFSRYKAARRAPASLVWPKHADRSDVDRISQGVFLARDLINTPTEDMGPDELIAAGVELAKDAGATVRVLRGDELLAHNYPTIHAVGRASTRAPALLDFSWGDDNAPKVTLVGKGVCFDTGGLNIKPREGMLEMKKDMGGAAIVLGLAKALMAGHTPIRLRVLVPAVENSISGNAYRPLDIIRTRAGKTVEIGNTDAEGRLILCDALAEADGEAPELLIDFATLTGAARIALGPEVQAFFCDNDDVATTLQETGARFSDPLWRLPIWRPYRKLIEGKCADLNNVAPNAFAGSIIGALYLSEFVSAANAWVHLDVMASNPTAKPGRPEGGEATGLRAVYHYIRNRYRVTENDRLPRAAKRAAQQRTRKGKRRREM